MNARAAIVAGLAIASTAVVERRRPSVVVGRDHIRHVSRETLNGPRRTFESPLDSMQHIMLRMRRRLAGRVAMRRRKRRGW